MTVSPELIAVSVLACVCAALAAGLLRQSRRLNTLVASQRALLQQLDGTHRAQLAYAEATEDAMTHLRDGLQTLTTVSANLDMKTYALELQQGRMGQRIKQQEKARQATPSSAPPEVVKNSSPSIKPAPMTPPPRPASAAERELITAVHTRRARVA